MVFISVNGARQLLSGLQFFLIVMLASFIGVSFISAERKVSLFVNPGCGDLCSKVTETNPNQYANLVHVKADGDNDTIHYIWSSIGSFGVLMATTDPRSEMTIDWNRILSSDPASSITFSPPAGYSSAVILTTLWSYKDVGDTGDITNAWFNLTTAIPFRSFTWEEVRAQNLSATEARAEFILAANDSDSYYANKTLKLIMLAFGDDAHYSLLPMLPHTSSSLQMELILDGFNSPHNNSHNTRFALEMSIVSSQTTADTDSYVIEKLRSIDDEYTPGVFTTVHVTAPRSHADDIGSFLLWKPICYTEPDRTTEDSTDTHESIGNFTISERSLEMADSLANAFYGPDFLNSSVTFVNVSYGLEGDGFYGETNFLSWTAVIGLGSPPNETFSTLVIIVIIVGFGIPTLLILIGGLFVVVKRLRSRGDELLLNNHHSHRRQHQSKNNSM